MYPENRSEPRHPRSLTQGELGEEKRELWSIVSIGIVRNGIVSNGIVSIGTQTLSYMDYKYSSYVQYCST